MKSKFFTSKYFLFSHLFLIRSCTHFSEKAKKLIMMFIWT